MAGRPAERSPLCAERLVPRGHTTPPKVRTTLLQGDCHPQGEGALSLEQGGGHVAPRCRHARPQGDGEPPPRVQRCDPSRRDVSPRGMVMRSQGTSRSAALGGASPPGVPTAEEPRAPVLRRPADLRVLRAQRPYSAPCAIHQIPTRRKIQRIPRTPDR